MYLNRLSKIIIYFLLSFSVCKSKPQFFFNPRSIISAHCNQIPSFEARMNCLESLRVMESFDQGDGEPDMSDTFNIQHSTHYSSSSKFVNHDNDNNYGQQYTNNYERKNVPCGVIKQKTRQGQTKIVGGTDATKGEFPWLVSVQTMKTLKFPFKYKHDCGGAIIHEYYIITAAHCVFDLRQHQVSIVAGEHKLDSEEGDEQRFSVVDIMIQDEYKDDEPFPNDIALLRVSQPINFDGYLTAPICLPNSSTKFGPGINGTVAGWGKLNEYDDEGPARPKKVTLPITEKKQCQEAYREAGLLNECQFCATAIDKDSCQGDSGGPMVCKLSDGRHYLCGIVSWGLGCARKGYPGIYTHVPCYVDYINKNIN